MPIRKDTGGGRRIVFGTGQSNAIGTGSSLPLTNQSVFGIRGGHKGSAKIIRPFPVEVEPWLETVEGNVFGEGDGYDLVFGADASYNEPGELWEVVVGAAAQLKRTEWDVGGVQNRYVITGAGLGGTTYAGLGPSSAPWIEMKAELTAAYATLSEAEKNKVSAYSMHVSHGEQDSAEGTTQATYESNLEEWRTLWRDDVNGITGRSDEPPMFIDMMNVTSLVGTEAADILRQNILRAQREFGDTTNGYVVGPKPSIMTKTVDGVHYASLHQSHYIGEQHGKVAWRVIEEGEDWVPLRYSSITAQSGNVVRVALEVPRGNAVLDSRKQRYAGNGEGQLKGFTYLDDGSATIIGIDVQATYIDLQLDAAPSTNPTLSHGYSSVGEIGGVYGFGRTYVRDEDTEYTSQMGEPLYNWLCPFIREPVV